MPGRLLQLQSGFFPNVFLTISSTLSFAAFVVAATMSSYRPISFLQPAHLIMSSSFGGCCGKTNSVLPQATHLKEILSGSLMLKTFPARVGFPQVYTHWPIVLTFELGQGGRVSLTDPPGRSGSPRGANSATTEGRSPNSGLLRFTSRFEGCHGCSRKAGQSANYPRCSLQERNRGPLLRLSSEPPPCAGGFPIVRDRYFGLALNLD